jgi:hypothetical protein
MTTVSNRNEHSHTHNNATPIAMPLGRQQAANSIHVANDPRHLWRGFSFAGYWFSYYYYFSNASPSSAARQMMPG